MSTNESTCRNHTNCEGCALARCCPVKLEALLEKLKRQRESGPDRIQWLNVDILGFDRRTAANVAS